jgi:hypothetical protein
MPNQIAGHREQVDHVELPAASTAVGAGSNDRLASRHPVGGQVDEAPKQQTDNDQVDAHKGSDQHQVTVQRARGRRSHGTPPP